MPVVLGSSISFFMFLAVLRLPRHMRLSSSCREYGQLSSRRAWACSLCVQGRPPGARTEPGSPASAGGFLTSEPPGEAQSWALYVSLVIYTSFWNRLTSGHTQFLRGLLESKRMERLNGDARLCRGHHRKNTSHFWGIREEGKRAGRGDGQRLSFQETKAPINYTLGRLAWIPSKLWENFGQNPLLLLSIYEPWTPPKELADWSQGQIQAASYFYLNSWENIVTPIHLHMT